MGEPLYVFQDKGVLVNYKTSISTVEGCIALCKQYSQCQWWNYNPIHSTCWLKKGQGNPRRESGDSAMYTGHRDSTDQCEDRSDFTPDTLQPNSGTPTSGWFSGLFSNNPCPNGQINTNCYNDMHLNSCVRCCTGDVRGTDGTPACIH